MFRFHGVTAPAGEGIVLEVHLDLAAVIPAFERFLRDRGFEDDPFSAFKPEWCTRHMTGRTRVRGRRLSTLLPVVNAAVGDVLAKARECGIDLYVEVELVRGVWRAREVQPKMDWRDALAGFRFRPTGRLGGSRADIHVEFPTGEVAPEVRGYLVERQFYWVATPMTRHCPPEEIATLQPTSYTAARQVYQALVRMPLPNCSAIHLEQKLRMEATSPALTMPEVISVTRAA